MNEPEGVDIEAPASRWRGIARSILLPAAILAVILGGLWWWDSRGGGGDSRYGIVELPAERNPTGRDPAPEVGRAAPDFLLERPEGGELRLSDLQGRPLLVNFWATWCAPCRAEMPELVAAFERFRPDGLLVVGVNLQEPDDQVLDFAEEFGITFPLAVDREGELSDAWRLGGPFDGIPTSYFIDRTGVIRDIHLGPLNEEALAERITGLLLPGVTG